MASSVAQIPVKSTEQRLEEALKALKFYANRESWQNYQQGWEELPGSCDANSDKGKRARAALAGFHQ